MDNVLKKKPVNMEDMQAYTRILSNLGIVSEGVCSTAAATAAKTVTLGATFSLENKATILVTFTNGISVANSTLAITHTNIAGTEITETAKPIYLNGAALEADVIPEGARIILRYNGTQFDVIGGAGGRIYTNGDGISIVNNEISVKAGTNLSIDSNGYLNATDTTYSDATTTDSGLMSASDKTKLNGIESGANNYSLPTASANTLGGVKVGSNLSIDQNGVLSAAAAANEVQIGGETPSSSSDVEIFIDTTEDAIAEVYTKQQQDGKFVVIKDLNAAPTESTLTYTENGTVKNFKQGDEVRVPDAEADNGYTFYKLYELTTSGNTTTATWDKLGAGGGEDMFEKAIISLEQNGGNSADLIGATITISETSSGVVIATFTWNGSPINYSIAPNTNYTVSVSTIEGYLTPKSQTFLSEWVNVRPIVVRYNSSIGVYIEATDGSLYTNSSWSNSGKTANAVVVLTSACKVRMSLTRVQLPIHSNYSDPLENYITAITVDDAAKLDFDGAGNTTKIIQFNTAYNTNTTSYAAPYCRNYEFTYPQGQKGSLPSSGQLWVIYQNMTDVNACLSACGSTTLSGVHWSSTNGEIALGGLRRCWIMDFSNALFSYQKIENSRYVLPVSAYE